MGVLSASLFILPIYGLATTMLALVVCCLVGVLTLMLGAVKDGKRLGSV